MIRILSLATVIAFALVLPAAAADDANVKAPATTADVAPARGNLFTEEQARVHLSRLGYTDISPMTKDQNGNWRGTATKDGKTLTVAVDIKGSVRNN